MSTLLVQALNTAVYTAVLFLIAGGLSLVYGVMRVVNLAHGNLYMVGAFVMAWAAGSVAAGAAPKSGIFSFNPGDGLDRGDYTILLAVFLNDNLMNPDVKTVAYRR